jgi:two-component system sensor histidine kinase KdpD
MLVLKGRTLPASDQVVLTAFAAQTAVALERSRLAGKAAEADGSVRLPTLLSALKTRVGTSCLSILAGCQQSGISHGVDTFMRRPWGEVRP